MNFQGKSFIGSQRGDGKKSCGRGINPASGESLDPTYFSATPEEVETAVNLATEAFVIYRRKDGKEKAIFLRAIAENIEEKMEHLIARMPLETGLPEMRVRGEAARTIGQLRMFADLVEEGSWVDARIEHSELKREPLPKPDMRSMLLPLGPVVVFCASNFPLAYSVAGGDVASALASGCPVIVKAHSSHPGVAEIVGTAVREAVVSCGLPEGVFSLLYGSGKDIGQILVKHPEVKAVGFTGSQKGGRNLMDLAAARPEPIPVYAEMSAVNPLFLLPSAFENGVNLAEQFYASLTMGAGQFCTNPGLVFLFREGSDKFIQRLSELVNGGETMTMLNQGIFDAYQAGEEDLIHHKKVKVLANNKNGDIACGASLFGIDIEAFLAENFTEEVFGPSSLLVFCSSVDDFIGGLEKLGGQLTASIHLNGNELEDCQKVLQMMERKAGRLIYNGFPTGLEVCHATVHGGPYPATSDGRTTSVGSLAIHRFTRLIAYQDFPDIALPAELQESNPLAIRRLVDGKII